MNLRMYLTSIASEAAMYVLTRWALVQIVREFRYRFFFYQRSTSSSDDVAVMNELFKMVLL